jgi:hypothetical protein
MSSPKSERARGPKTELDEKFLSVARQVMRAHGITSDRAISLALGRKADFINRVSNGAQSATPEAWDILLNMYPEARNIMTNSVMNQGSGQAIGTNHGTINQEFATLPELEKHIEDKLTDFASKHDLVIRLENAQLLIFEVKSFNEQLKSQLADKERIIRLLEQNLQEFLDKNKKP